MGNLVPDPELLKRGRSLLRSIDTANTPSTNDRRATLVPVFFLFWKSPLYQQMIDTPQSHY
jgi:hypothetical protein